MIEYLREIHPKSKNMSPNELIASDPVSVSRFIKNKFEAIIDFITSPDNPIGEVSHYFVRREYQGRGTQHFHMLIWIKDAPIINESSTEDVAAFILKYVTCRIPSKMISPELHRRVDTHQRHKHNSYCLRTKKTNNKTNKICRFGFSRPITETLLIRDVAVSMARRKKLKTKSRLYDLPRSQDEININDYNPSILCAWEGNMDIQFVGEKSTLLTWYTTKYVSKSEKSNIQDAFEVINSTKSLCSNLWNIGMRMLNHRECGALEAADNLLGIPLFITDPDTTIRWVDVNMISSRKLKSKKEIESLNPDSTDIFCHSMVDYYYPTRPKALECLCLYDFVKWYDRVKDKPVKKVECYKTDDNFYLKKRLRGCLVDHYHCNIETHPESYFYTLILLFKPWRDRDELKCGHDTYAEAFLSLQPELVNGLKYHERNLEIQKGIDIIKEQINKNIEESNNDDECSKDHPLDCVPIEAEGAMKEFHDVANKCEDLDLTKMISELNSDQKRVFDKVTKTLLDNNEILRLYVSGEGGTGKSFLIKTIRCWVKQTLRKDAIVSAPTGIAAFNVDGLTIHRLFQLPVEHGRTAHYTELSDVALKVFREELKNVELIIIDEVSMISNLTLMYINLRLVEIFNTKDSKDGWFGKKHMLFFGDLLQLPPVRDGPPFIKLSKLQVENYIGALSSFDLWTNLFSYDELKINMRQKGDTLYKDILSRIRIGTVQDSDTKILLSKKIKFQSIEIDDRIQELCEFISNLSSDSVCLLPTCNQCDALNEAMLNRITSNDIQLIAHDATDCPIYLKKKVLKVLNAEDEDSTRTAGLARIITVKIGARIMLRRNIDITLGLDNGTIATIKSVTYSADNNNDVEKLQIVLSTGIEHTIERVSAKFEVMDRVYVIRKQFPISLSYGMTIHKSQGLSLHTAIVDVGNSIFTCGQAYVALSRLTKLEGLHIINYDPSSVKASDLAILEYNRLRQKFRPELEKINIFNSKTRKLTDTIWMIPKNIMECQISNNENPSNVGWNVKGITDENKIASYANATMQCMLYCSSIRNSTFLLDKNDLMNRFIIAYRSNTNIITLDEIRQYLGYTYFENIQQDASKFLVDVCKKFHYIQPLVENNFTTTSRCVTYQNYSVWIKREKHCKYCNGKYQLEKVDITASSNVLIIQFVIFKIVGHQLMKIKQCGIKGIPTTKLRIMNNIYKVIGGIFHDGDTITEGHYTAILRSTGSTWITVDNNKIINSKWPRNANNLYILFLEKV
ncbi:uncharacterized protein [Prorops nasuta]|uniref:uncharacterized protein n=1 Tax=Prorops nasuta TaxID=863751 RepID=UPI0034CFFB35